MADDLKEAVERVTARIHRHTDDSQPEIVAGDLRTILAALSAAEARERVLRDACQPFVKAWVIGRRTFQHDGKTHETASRQSLGLTDEGSLQIGDFERLMRAITPETPHAE
jgi:stage V sporulation protein SpoVS